MRMWIFCCLGACDLSNWPLIYSFNHAEKVLLSKTFI
jgi:hypothetical protein